jgi:hypothetical protein
VERVSRIMHSMTTSNSTFYSINTTKFVRFGSKTDILGALCDVRFTSKSGHRLSLSGCPLSAKSGHSGYFDSRLICCSTTTGSVNANVEPWPGCDSTHILPPCISMMRFEMASPKPVPPFLRVMALSACWNS